jgi:hypothetical protein
VLTAVLAVLLLLGSALAGTALLDDSGRPEAAQPGPGPATGPAAPSPSASADPSSPASDDEASASAKPTPTRTSSSTAPPPAPSGTRAGFVDGYFDTVPTDLDAAWRLLSPQMRAEVGRASFDGFWSRIADVDASSVTARDGAVEATVPYTYESGRVVRQVNQYQLVRTEDGYLIDEEEVITSTTVSQ